MDFVGVASPYVGRRYKRRLIVDEEKVISNLEMRANISDPSDTVSTPAMAPPTKRLMHWKMNGGVEKIFGVPGRQHNSRDLHGGYKDRLIARPAEDEYFNMLGDHETEGIELKYAPGEKELQQMLEMLAATKGRPGREPKNKGRPCRKPKTVKTETVTESVYFAPVSIQPLDLTQANLVTVKLEEKEGISGYDAEALSSALASTNAYFQADQGNAENKEIRIMRVG